MTKANAIRMRVLSEAYGKQIQLEPVVVSQRLYGDLYMAELMLRYLHERGYDIVKVKRGKKNVRPR